MVAIFTRRPLPRTLDAGPFWSVRTLPVSCTGTGLDWLPLMPPHCRRHSSRVGKLLELPWQPPYQKCEQVPVSES